MTTGTEIISAQRLETGETIRPSKQSQSRQECDRHRAWIGIRVEALLDPYWDKRPDIAVKAEILADWMAALDGYGQDDIRAACRAYLAGLSRGSKPKPGDIVDLIERAKKIERIAIDNEMRRSGGYLIAAPPETQTERCSKEAAAKILRQAGFWPKSFSEELGDA